MVMRLSGATRLFPIVGDPIAHVRSPEGLTEHFAAADLDVVCVPFHVSPEDFSAFVALLRAGRNFEGAVVTMPHKFAAYRACDQVSDRSRFLRSVNAIMRDAQGRLEGDMFDGLGLVAAATERGCAFPGRRVLLVGAGGAGTAIAHAIAGEGVSEIGICDIDGGRRTDLVARLVEAGLPATAAEPKASGFDIIVNATPLGMRRTDPLPVDTNGLSGNMFVAEVVTMPAITPLLRVAREKGCRTSTGDDMFQMVAKHLVACVARNRSRT
ncbi:MAG: shikimate dehydrogenase [Hyphomicrobiaceae bacterium]|nr:MAG: shikimate dehydrogenase [Hyphomicrobiaceae bacterium]